MIDYSQLEKQLAQAIGLTRRPVAVTFSDHAPAGVPKFSGSMPSGCSFWRLAGDGRAFYTVPSDHYNCPIGSYTHHIALPEARRQELDQTLSLMVRIGYLKMEEVPGIPQLPRAPQAVVYAPLGEAPVDPDVVIFSGPAGRIMQLQEAALRAGVASLTPPLGRPSCMALPAAMAQGAVTSTGCIGNRVYTEIGEDELYFVIPGKDLPTVAQQARTVAEANANLAEYHRLRRQQLASE